MIGRPRLETSVSTMPSIAAANERPDLLDLIEERYDQQLTSPARRTLIICSAPRTGSYELCRLLVAAGLGLPHEYFHPQFATILARRWSISGDPLAPEHLGEYLALLRQRRATTDLFATKLQFWQFDQCLRNKQGAALFNDALVVHLYRASVADQFNSFRRAWITGQWDFSPRQSATSRPETFEEVLSLLDKLIAADAGFRRLFALLGINPMFVTFDDVAKRPRELIEAIASRLSLPVNLSLLEKMLKFSNVYPKDATAPDPFCNKLIDEAFRAR